MPLAVFYQATVYVALVHEGLVQLKEWRVDRTGPRAKVIWMAEKLPGILEHVRKCLRSPPLVVFVSGQRSPTLEPD